jgi:mannose-1-phosphate guanylyltransferase
VPLPVFLLAAGFGTRLRPLTTHLPKPLLPIGDRPALAHILAAVRPVASRLVANAHHRADDLRAFLERESPDVLPSVEAEILGTAGGLERAGDLLGAGDVLVWNGDIFTDLGATELMAAHTEPALATLAVAPLPAGEGTVGVNAEGCVVRLRKETTMPGEVRGGSFLGVHVVGSGLRKRLPKKGCLVGDVYLPALRRGERLAAFDAGHVVWHDIGTLADYAAANFAWLGSRQAWVSEDAHVAPGVTFQSTLVGRGAEAQGQGALTRCIVWPGARAVAPLEGAVVAPWGVTAFSG